jgi:hypothetical protein
MKMSFEASMRVASAYSTSAGSRMSMSSSTTITMSRSFSAPNDAMMALRCRPSCCGPVLLHLHDGVEAVQPAGRHLGVGDDRHRALQHLEQARLQHVLAQHHGLAAVAVDGVIDRRSRCVTAVISNTGPGSAGAR